jgi:hypothetical protein
MNMSEIIRVAKEILLKQGAHHPTVFVELNGNPPEMGQIVLTRWPDLPEQREHLLYTQGRQLGHRYPKRNLLHIALLMEAWYRDLAPGTHRILPPSVSLRREVLLVLHLDVSSGSQTAQVIEMIRDNEGTLRDLLLGGAVPEARGMGLQMLLRGFTDVQQHANKAKKLMQKRRGQKRRKGGKQRDR